MTRRIYSIFGSTPEVSAYGMAKYSRSSLALSESIKELSQQKAEEFLNTFYFQYGHSSIADLAHVALAIENVSILAALLLVDEPLWDGQERSTRYQDFMKTKYYLPDGAPEHYVALADELFQRYEQVTVQVKEALVDQYEIPVGMSEEAYHRTLRARAFDVSRYWLPLATNTSLGQITSARTLERQISRLYAQGLSELTTIATEMRDAVVKKPPVNFSSDEIGPLLPTLAKYTSENQHMKTTRQALQKIAEEVLADIKPEIAFGVDLHVYQDPLTHACTSLLYSVSNLSYRQINQVVEGLEYGTRQEILDITFATRGKHDSWLRELQAHPLIFDITMDIGSFRDLNRHRKVSKILQAPSVEMGYAIPDPLEELQMTERYRQQMDKHYQKVEQFATEYDRQQATYLLPMGAMCRSLHQMDLHQVAYLTELRTGSTGHFSYREIAYQMYEKVAELYPEFARYMRVTNPREVFNPFQR